MRIGIEHCGYYQCRVGDFIVTAINDGMLDVTTEVVIGISKEECERLEAANFRRRLGMSPAAATVMHSYRIHGCRHLPETPIAAANRRLGRRRSRNRPDEPHDRD